MRPRGRAARPDPRQRRARREHPASDLRSWSSYSSLSGPRRPRELTGIDNGYRRTGGVDVATTADEAAELQGMAGRWRTEGIVFEKLAPRDIQQVEPALRDGLAAVYYLPDRAQVRNPWHLRALELAAVRLGATLRPDLPVLGFECDGSRVRAVRTPEGSLPCGCLVVAAGAGRRACSMASG
ncbi:MAG: FAD-dependent oxidoreductase [Isosphaeraceae bacterium]